MYVYDFLARLAAFLLVIVSTVVIWLLVLLSLVLHLIRRFPGVPSMLTVLEAGLRRFLVRGLGDAKVYIDERIWAANARREFEVAFEAIAQDPQVESVTVVAHSWGAVVAYEALSNSRVMASYSPGGQHAKPIHFITCGSGLNRAWDMVRSTPKDHLSWYRLDRPLVNVANWLDIWADFDPVPAGPARPLPQASRPFVTTLSGPASKPVTNLDEPLNDHGGYWTNYEMVLPHIAAALQHGGPQIPGTAFDAKAQGRRENQVVWLTLLRTLVIAAVVAIAVWVVVNPEAARATLAALRDALRAVPYAGPALVDSTAWLTGFLPRGLLVWMAWVAGGFVVATVVYRVIQARAFPRLK
ncbi:MAG: alpha/beta hydrolase [Chloroflexi bacterium]|nr:alpha/beta hydrolase [Chloroflexota bacterium]